MSSDPLFTLYTELSESDKIEIIMSNDLGDTGGVLKGQPDYSSSGGVLSDCNMDNLNLGTNVSRANK